MQKLFNLLTRSHKPKQDDLPDEPGLPPPTHMNLFKREKDPDEATRPLYRVGKHKASDFQKVIDLSG